ncbi:Glucose-6-phosphate exchanger SLC37A1 [Liparis tanakae]|uniref:Glucose-6-phosphate exchanger SLC37A1 n=1 Tax=Liparis tanakae TaxID=230148 RepID=A0A4Z2G689_9TELE|nr:Glucose-6-phosphate exchanger SLC37A1 [Liparis tanakae]
MWNVCEYMIYFLFKQLPTKSWNGVNGNTEVYVQYKDNNTQVNYYYKDSVANQKGVIEFSLCLLFAKLVSYTFLFWLPLYITKAGEDQTQPQPSLNRSQLEKTTVLG